MPAKKTMGRARRARRQTTPTAPGTVRVRKEATNARTGKRKARSPKQAIAIGLSQGRRAGSAAPGPNRGRSAEPSQVGTSGTVGARKTTTSRSSAAAKARGRTTPRSAAKTAKARGTTLRRARSRKS